MKHPFRYGSHLPVMLKVLGMTTGPVAELGAGDFSTPFLHWYCSSPRRELVTYENDKNWLIRVNRAGADWHRIVPVGEWAAVDLSGPWSVVLVDHAPAERRAEEMKRLTHAEYVVAHDTENRERRWYGYESINGLYRFRWKYRGAMPHTTVYSNLHDLSGFSL